MKYILNKTTAAIALLLSTHLANAGMINIAGDYSVRLESMVDKRFDRIYRQQFDFSCGSATLASLLSFHYNDTVDELSVFKDMFKHGDKEKIRAQGFSLLDMKRYLTRRGYISNGFRITLQQLAQAKRPAITIINTGGYMHFVIIKAQRDNRIVVGDPAVGLKIMTQEEFDAVWENDVFFLIQNNEDVAAYHYQFDKHQQPYAPANLAMPVDIQRLDILSVVAPGNWDF